MSASAAAEPPARLTVLSGPSGVGKGTVVAELRRLAPGAWISVSCTTRPPRPGETDGREYRFVTRAEFDELVAGGEMLEWAEFAGNRYGTPREPVLQHLSAGVPTVLEIELQGARQVRGAMPHAQFVFLAPPSLPVLVERLAQRGTDSAQAQAERLRIAQVELAAASEFDRIVINDEVERAAAELAALL